MYLCLDKTVYTNTFDSMSSFVPKFARFSGDPFLFMI